MATPRGKSPAFSRTERHRNLYKNGSPQSCQWRDTYRKRCFERLRNSRENLLQKFRGNDVDGDSPSKGSVVNELMQEEWKLMQWEERQARLEMKRTHGQMDDSLLEDLNEGVVFTIMEELQSELMAEESAIIAEYEASLQLAEASLNAAVEQLETDELSCPICKKNPLMLNKGVIFCACGMRINTEQDCITLTNVRQQLSCGVDQHCALCHGHPVFTVTDALGAQNLVLSCQICDYLYIVI